MDRQTLRESVEAALMGNWHKAHEIVQQDEYDPLACWIHAVLHKIEGDTWNSRYWYARTDHPYEEWDDPLDELRAILVLLSRS
ncbi:MAG: hypothetical protein HXY27_09215 [Hydrogenophilaceae bacterium]|nr:hypothetical protein [Hydrogenophilaceae bacterium]